MAYAVASMIQRVRRILQDYPYEQATTSSYTAGGVTIAVADGTKWREGDILEDIAGPQYYVKSVATNNLTVIPSYNGTTSANMASGTRVFKNPVFGYQEIKDKVEAVIQTLWPWAWTTESSTETAPSPTSTWVDLSVTMIDLISVRQLYSSNPSRLGEYGADGGLPVVFMRNLPVGLAASTVGIQFPNGLYDASNQIFVTGRRLITATIAANNYSDLSGGLDVECIAMGAAALCVADKEVPRVTQQDVSQGDVSVVPLRKLQTAAFYDARYRQRLNDWWAYLMATIPPMSNSGW